MEPEGGVNRKLTAILSADVAGYSRLMADDEAATVETLTRYRRVFADTVERHDGRVVDSPGDNVLAEFASVVEAVECANEIQRELAWRNRQLAEHRRMDFRIGINLGDVIVREDGTIYGDGVNIAARLESLAEPGGVMISESAHMQVRTKLDLGFADAGAHQVKNIAEPVRVYRVHIVPGAAPSVSGAREEQSQALELPDKPSIAVLPFKNLSGDPEQEYFVDGFTEEVITALSRFRNLFVIASNSAFIYKGKPVKVQDVARELGVQYVLEGSVQRIGDRLRVTAQLVDATTGHHVWAESYNRAAEDLFAVQDEVTQHIVATVGSGDMGQLARAGLERAKRKPTENLEAYDYYLLGLEHWGRNTKEDNAIARQLLEKAIELDPEYARAHAQLAWVHRFDQKWGWSDSPAESGERAFELAKKAVALDPSDGYNHWALGAMYFFNRHQYEEGVAGFERALALNPNSAEIVSEWGFMLSFMGRAEEGGVVGQIRRTAEDMAGHALLVQVIGREGGFQPAPDALIVGFVTGDAAKLAWAPDSGPGLTEVSVPAPSGERPRNAAINATVSATESNVRRPR